MDIGVCVASHIGDIDYVVCEARCIESMSIVASVSRVTGFFENLDEGS